MEEKLTEVIKFIASNGWPFRMHASFDFTAQRILAVVEKVHQEVPVNKLRWGLEHCEGMTARTLDRLQSLGGSLGLQNRMSSDGEAYVTKWGKEAAEDAPAFGRIKKMGVPFALGTDGNRAASHNPWVGVQWLVTGKTQGGLRHAADRNLMSREEALHAYSAAGAWMSNEEDKKGTLSVGKWADLAVLSDDYLTVPEGRISQLSSVLTMVGGKVVYGDGKYAALAPAAQRVSATRTAGEMGRMGREREAREGDMLPRIAIPAPPLYVRERTDARRVKEYAGYLPPERPCHALYDRRHPPHPLGPRPRDVLHDGRTHPHPPRGRGHRAHREPAARSRGLNFKSGGLPCVEY